MALAQCIADAEVLLSDRAEQIGRVIAASWSR